MRDNDTKGVDLNKVLLAIGDDQERLYYVLGAGWASPPSLHETKYEPGTTTRDAVNLLLDRIEKHTTDWHHIRAFLAGCYGTMESSMPLTHLWQLAEESKPAARAVVDWIIEAGGLQLEDFADGGARFLRLALRKRPHTITRIVSAEFAST